MPPSQPADKPSSSPAPVVLIALVGVLVLAQAWYSSLTISNILYEELAESVRNPLWLAHGFVYDGVSSNVGWYALIAACYHVFGFSLTLSKIVRVVLHALSLACLAHLLVRCFGWRRALVPLTVVGLSPVILYFNTLRTTYGIDLQWASVIVWLLWQASGTLKRSRLGIHAALGLGVMFACLMWPVCLFYVPLWLVVYVLRSRATGARIRPFPIALAALFAAIPFAGMLGWLHNASTWLHDPVTGSGVFRGGGTGLVGSPSGFARNVARVVLDATVSGSSYYFWLPRPDFSGVLGLVSVAAVAALIPAMWGKSRAIRILVAALLAAAAGNAAIAGAVAGPPGLRRATVCVAVLYGLYILAWGLATEHLQSGQRPWRARMEVAALSLLLVHHALAFMTNARSLRVQLSGMEPNWFAVAPTPQAAVRHWAETLESGGALDCREVPGPVRSCRYAEVYAAVAAQLRWSYGRSHVELMAYDPDRGQYVPLSPETWPFGSRR